MAINASAGEMAALMERKDWSQTRLGPRERWPQSLKTALSIVMSSRFPMIIFWGPDLCVLYNDAYIPIFASKHPDVLGRTGFEAWGEAWDVIGPMFEAVMERGDTTWSRDQLLVLRRKGFDEETYLTWSYSPITDESGGVGGVFTSVIETTQNVLSERRLKALRDLGENVSSAKTPVNACAHATRILDALPADVPFSLLYLTHESSATLVAASGIDRSHELAAGEIPLDAPRRPWPLFECMHGGQLRVVENLERHGARIEGRPWPDPVSTAAVLPIPGADPRQPVGFLVAGLSPRLEFDTPYRSFLTLFANQVGTNIANAIAYEEERRRAEALAELDRAKTAFFSNVSHEFRTPLTLMLGPVEDILAKPEQEVYAENRELLGVVHRNGMRLLRLVNTLLDFSRIEAGRIEAVYEPTDLAALTTDLASGFRSAIERVGLRLRVDCPPLPEPVYVDREMWEKIVLNLLSNALKFTFEGDIVVELRVVDAGVELVIRDTGIGISEAELPHLFERFHRVKGVRARTHEGSGIGLALVQELVKLHDGNVAVSSQPGKGTTFRIGLRFGTSHLPTERIQSRRTLSATALGVAPFVEEALRWDAGLPEAAVQDSRTASAVTTGDVEVHAALGRRARVVLADDNADMRDYVRRLISPLYDVEAVADGEAALQAIRRELPDLVLTDVMMPGLDGFGLLQALRADPATRNVPVIMVSARAGDESRVEGFDAGADDYLTKPFNARELIARVQARLEIARLRRLSEDALREEVEVRTALARVGARLAAELDSDRLVQAVIDAGTELTTAQFGAFFYNVVNASGETYLLHTLSGAPKEAFQAFPTPRATALFGPTFRGEGIVRIDDVTKDARYGKNAPYRGMPSGHLPVRSYLAVPVIGSSGSVLGGLFFGHAEPAVFTGRHEQLAAGIASWASVALDNARLYHAAQEANRLKDEFLATLSHELRTPLNALLGWSQMLRTTTLSTATRNRALESIERNARIQAQLVEDLLDVSRIMSGRLKVKAEPVDVAAAIDAAVDTVRPSVAAKRLRLDVDVPRDSIVQITGDADRLQQIVWNLLSNAVKFTPANGQIAVRLACSESAVELTVRDTGRGIDAAFLPHLFQRFSQADGSTSREHGGLGLGLAIVRHLTEAHGGTVSAQSAGPDHGTTFTVRLPLRAVEPRGAIEGPGTEEERTADLSDRRILVVDDQADARDLLRTMLEACGATVTTAGSAGEALYALRASEFDLLIADIGMPGQDGYALIDAVRTLTDARRGRIPALAVTAYASMRERDKALEAGFDGHMAKPVDPGQLIVEVDMALARQASYRSHPGGDGLQTHASQSLGDEP